MIIIGDIGGTHMRIAVSDTPGSFEEPILHDTPQDFVSACALFAQATKDAARGRSITRGIIGIAGLISDDHTTLVRSPHLRDWEGRDIARAFGEQLGAPVYIENDAMLGGLGEAHYGAGKDASVLAYLTVGTGIGGARIINGTIDHHTSGFEIGHQRLTATQGTAEWEELVSGSALTKRYGSSTAALSDPTIKEISADAFAFGLYNTILHWSPDCVVLDGALFGDSSIPLDRVVHTLGKIATAIPNLPEIHIAQHRGYATLYGALALAEAL